MSRLSFLDLAFFLTESADSPKHVAGLLIFKKPPGSSTQWVHKLAKEFASFDEPTAPFDKVIDFRALGGPRWRTTGEFSIEDHLFYHRAENVLSERDLFAYCSELHEPLMDRNKPMWEFHIIDRVAGGRFAVYSKMHHAYADGVTMSRWTMSSLNSSARARTLQTIWARESLSDPEIEEATDSREAMSPTLHPARLRP